MPEKMSHVCRNCGFAFESSSVRTFHVDSDFDNQAWDPRTQLQQLDSEIAQAEALTQALKKKRVTVAREINRLHGSPILRLPPELASEIFTACLPEFDISWGNMGEISTLPHSMTPLLIGMVCSPWREMVLSTPQLWSKISLSLDRCTPLKCDLVNEWLVRSGQSHLSIHLNCTLNHEQITQSSALLSILDVIASSSGRWSRIFFSLHQTCYNALESICHRLPLLTFMSLHLHRRTWFQPFSGFSDTPLLHHLEINGYNDSAMELSHGQLTQLSLSWITSDECVEILNRCPNLTHCTFTDVVSSREQFPSVLAPKIEYLNLASDCDSIDELLDALNTPAATELRIDNHGIRLPYSSFLSFISRSACTLRRLALSACPLSFEQLRLCLQAVPSIIDFEFSVLGMMDIVIQILDNGHPSNKSSLYLLPNLRSLTLNRPEFSLPALASMLSSRWRNDAIYPGNDNPGRLQSVVVSTGRCIYSDTVSTLSLQLQHLVAEGMEITLTTETGGSLRL